MKATARGVARRVLARVGQGSYATLALGGELERADLSPQDRRLATELVYGVLRRRSRLDRALGAASSRGIGRLDERTLDALRLAAYQVLFLRVPAHAAVDDAVGAVRRARGQALAGFANALLRRLAADGEPPLPEGGDPLDRLSLERSLPRWLVARLAGVLGLDEAGRFLEAIDAPPPVWLRVNTLRFDVATVEEALRRLRPDATFGRSPLAPEALSVRGGGELFTGALFADGAYLAQDLAAQRVAHLVDPRPGERLLDACCGVGGKTTHLATLTGDRAAIDAVDRSPRKLDLARDHAHRLGVRGARFIEADLTDDASLPEGGYDRVLLDAPCSALGVLRRHPEARWRAAEAGIAEIAGLQARLLDNLCRRVRPGGCLVYAVCTFTDEEGPSQVDAFLAHHGEFSLERALLDEEGPRTWPQRHDADAFYAVRLRRR